MSLFRNKLYLLFVVILFHSCIEEYIPTIEQVESNKYVVSGLLTDQEGYHELTIALTSTINDPKLIPLSDCKVTLKNSSGDSLIYTEYKSGYYRAWISKDFLNIGDSYGIEITTPSGTKLISDSEIMNECPEIDSIYYIRESKPTNNPEINIEGIQFYLDIDATGTNSRFFKFDIVETWEYHAMYPLEWYYDGTVHHVFPPDYSNFICYKTEQVSDIFVVNTSNLNENKFEKNPLHYVDNKTSRLSYGYSLLVKQYSLTQQCYTFWNDISKNNLSDASLYQSIPFPVKGNIYNITDPKQTVMGCFQVSSVKTKRIFVSPLEDLELDYYMYCYSMLIRKDYKEYGPDDYPVYLLQPGFELNKECIICTSLGGTTTKPDFWPF